MKPIWVDNAEWARGRLRGIDRYRGTPIDVEYQWQTGYTRRNTMTGDKLYYMLVDKNGQRYILGKPAKGIAE